MATSLIIDTHQFVEDLKAGGFTDEQAESLTRVLKKSDLSQLVTKADLKTELTEFELRLTNTLTSRMVGIVGVGVAILALLKFV